MIRGRNCIQYRTKAVNVNEGSRQSARVRAHTQDIDAHWDRKHAPCQQAPRLRIRIITISLAVLRSQQSHEWLRMKESRCTCAFLLPDFNEGQPCASYLHEIIEKRHKYNNKLQDWNVILSSGKLADIRLPDVPTRPTLAMQNWFSTESSIPVSQNSAMTLTHPVKPYLVTNYGSVLLPLYKNKKWPVRR